MNRFPESRERMTYVSVRSEALIGQSGLNTANSPPVQYSNKKYE